eukprot:729746-Amphidinium_carterae.1
MAAFGPLVLERPREDLLACGIVRVPQQLKPSTGLPDKPTEAATPVPERKAAESSLASMGFYAAAVRPVNTDAALRGNLSPQGCPVRLAEYTESKTRSKVTTWTSMHEMRVSCAPDRLSHECKDETKEWAEFR